MLQVLVFLACVSSVNGQVQLLLNTAAVQCKACLVSFLHTLHHLTYLAPLTSIFLHCPNTAVACSISDKFCTAGLQTTASSALMTAGAPVAVVPGTQLVWH